MLPPGSARHWIARAVAIVIVIVGMWWLVRGIDLDALGRVLAASQPWPIVIAAFINFGLITCKAIAWRILLGPQYPVPVPRLINYMVTSSAASVILPLRGGEVVRLWMLRDRDGVPLTHSAAVAVAEKLLDIVSMLILVAPLPWLLDELPPSFGYWVPGLAIGVIVALIVLRIAAPRLRTTRFARFVEAMTVVQQPKVFVISVAILLAGWLLDLTMVMLVFSAVGLDLSIGAGVLVLFGINVAIAFPSTPAQFGAFEAGAMIGLHFLGAPDEKSLAFALAYHALQMIPLVIIGLLLNARWLVSRDPKRS